MQKNIFKFLFMFFMVGMLSACAPIYQTRYSYAPPSSPVGMACISNCSMAQNNCEQLGAIREEACKTRAEIAYQYCLKNNKDHFYCRREDCGNHYDSDHCVNQYNVCYQSCGGTITPTQVCVAFCN
jgi:hypothetical protein